MQLSPKPKSYNIYAYKDPNEKHILVYSTGLEISHRTDIFT